MKLSHKENKWRQSQVLKFIWTQETKWMNQQYAHISKKEEIMNSDNQVDEPENMHQSSVQNRQDRC